MQEIQSSIANTPEFEIVFVEFNKTKTIKDKLGFMDEIFMMIAELNNSVLILPQKIWDMLDDFENQKNQFLNGSQISDMENQIMDLNKTMSETIPDLNKKLDEINLNGTMDKFPDLDEMVSELDGGQEKLDTSKSDLGANDIQEDMGKLKDKLGDIPDLTEDKSKITDMKTQADEVNTDHIDALIDALDYCSPPCDISVR